MTKPEAIRLLREALERDARRPARDRFDDMVRRGAIDEQGRVLLRGPAGEAPSAGPPRPRNPRRHPRPGP